MRICPECKIELKVKSGATGFFMGCPNYPECRFTEALEAEPEADPVSEARADPDEPRGIDRESLIQQGIGEMELRARSWGVGGPQQVYRDMAEKIPGFGEKKSEDLTDEERELRLDYMMQALSSCQLRPLPYDKEDQLSD